MAAERGVVAAGRPAAQQEEDTPRQRKGGVGGPTLLWCEPGHNSDVQIYGQETVFFLPEYLPGKYKSIHQ